MDWKEKMNELSLKSKELAETAKDKYDDYKVIQKKANQEIHMKIGNKAIRQDINGLYYLGRYSEDAPRFTFENIDFSGSEIITHTKGKTKRKGRAGSALLGGLVGNMVLPGVGGIVGAATGASRGKKGSYESTSTQEEKPGKGRIYLRSVVDGEIIQIPFKATSAEFENIKRFFNKTV